MNTTLQENKDFNSKLVKGFAFAAIVGLIIGGISIFFNTFGDVKADLVNERVSLIAMELDIEEDEIVLEEKLLSNYYTAYTSNGEYKVQFDYSNEQTALRSIVKVSK